MEILNPETMNIVYLVLAVGIGWIVLRFIFKLARRIFALGCFAILMLGAVLFIFQFLGQV